jgi:hypothetical protein
MTIKKVSPPFTESAHRCTVIGAPSPLPCPFCTDSVAQIFDGGQEFFYAECIACGGEDADGLTAVEAAINWNMRGKPVPWHA